jgi:hypothetical protein
MPYKAKNCPKCGVTHNKRGPYCSRSCGNGREHSDEDKKIRSIKLKEYHQTPEGIATQKKSAAILSAYKRGEDWSVVREEDWAVDIPDVKDLSDYDIDGFERAEKW